MAIDTVEAGLGLAAVVRPKTRARIERTHTVTTTTKTPRNFRTKSPYKSRWRQQLRQEPTEEARVQIWIEIPAPSSLANKMAYAEQQRWITVQQKTFTKWLNTKLEARNLEVKDLVRDLSDGVRCILFAL
jgi:hypothetical protein